MENHSRDLTAEEYILVALYGTDEKLKKEAAEDAVGILTSQGKCTELIELSTNPMFPLRKEAAEEVISMHIKTGAWVPLVWLSIRDNFPLQAKAKDAVNPAAEKAIGILVDRNSVEELVGYTPDFPLKGGAAWKELIKLSNAPEFPLREMAAEKAIGILAGQGDWKELIELSTNPMFPLRKEAAEKAIGILIDHDHCNWKRLLGLSTNDNFPLQAKAKDALNPLAENAINFCVEEGDLHELLFLFEDPDFPLREEAAEGVIELLDTDSSLWNHVGRFKNLAPPLRKKAMDAVHISARNAINNCVGPDCGETLSHFSINPMFPLREEAAEKAISILRDQNNWEDLIELSENPRFPLQEKLGRLLRHHALEIERKMRMQGTGDKKRIKVQGKRNLEGGRPKQAHGKITT